jgi:hypothetical protein
VLFDFYMRHYMNYDAGSVHSGNDYSFGDVEAGNQVTAAVLSGSMTGSSPSFPSLDLTRPWMQSDTIFKLYAIYPDFPSYTPSSNLGSPGATIPNYAGIPYYHIPGFLGWSGDGSFWFSPNSTNASYARNFIENRANGWGFTQPIYAPMFLLANLPTIGSADYTALRTSTCLTLPIT